MLNLPEGRNCMAYFTTRMSNIGVWREFLTNIMETGVFVLSAHVSDALSQMHKFLVTVRSSSFHTKEQAMGDFSSQISPAWAAGEALDSLDQMVKMLPDEALGPKRLIESQLCAWREDK